MKTFDIIRCPKCHNNNLSVLKDKRQLKCNVCQEEFLIKDDQFIFITNKNNVFEINKVINSRSDPLRHWKTGGLINLLPIDAKKSLLLNLGAGNGSDSVFLRSRNFKVISTDLEYNQNLDVIADAQNLPFVDNTFDYVVMLSVLEHVTKPSELFSEIYRVLKPGGHLIASSAFLEPYHSYSRFHISALGIVQLLNENNLKIETLNPGWDVFNAILIGMFPFLRPLRWLFALLFNLVVSTRIFVLKWVKNKKFTTLDGYKIPIETFEKLKFSGSIIYKATK